MLHNTPEFSLSQNPDLLIKSVVFLICSLYLLINIMSNIHFVNNLVPVCRIFRIPVLRAFSLGLSVEKSMAWETSPVFIFGYGNYVLDTYVLGGGIAMPHATWNIVRLFVCLVKERPPAFGL